MKVTKRGLLRCLRGVLLAITVVGGLSCLIIAAATPIMTILMGELATVDAAGGTSLQMAADSIPENHGYHLSNARKQCERTPWTSQKLRQAHLDLEKQSERSSREMTAQDAAKL